MTLLQDKTGDLVAFTAVVECGSISAAAESLGIAPSSVSRALNRLEEYLGVRLIRRTTRRLDITSEGERFYGRVVRILADLEEAENEARNDAQQARGRLRVNVAVPFAIHQLIPRLERLRTDHPELQIDLIMTDALADLIEERSDVAIRIAPLSDSGLFSRHLANCSLLLVASKQYLTQYGTPQTLEELRAGHFAVHFIGVPMLNHWQVSAEDKTIQTITLPSKVAANNGEGVLELVRHGHGIALLSSFLVAQDLKAGKLVEVMPDLNQSSDQKISAVYTERLQNSARLKAFIDFLLEEFQGNWEQL